VIVNQQNLTSRERIPMAINHQEPDRVPVDLGATPSSGISAKAPDGTPIAKMPSGGTFFDQIHFPYVDGYPWQAPGFLQV